VFPYARQFPPLFYNPPVCGGQLKMRGVPRWLAVLAVVAIVAVVCAFTVHRALAPADFVLQLSDASLPADGFSSAELKIHSSNGRTLRGLEVQVENPPGAPSPRLRSGPAFSQRERVAVESVTIDHDSATVSLRAGVNPGETRLRISAPGFTPQEIVVQTALDASDTIGDGTPDFLRLHDPADRAAFRRWFTLLAESQYYRGKKLPTEIDDCAALLRFSYREALRAHDASWADVNVLPVPASAANVQQYQYPYTPLAASLFRVRDGSFTASDLGDGGGEQFIVYHTGPEGKSAGEIRRWSVAELVNYPEGRWRPIASNPAFLGVYRWNILRGDE
jgi:uncharacterized protein YfaT (DUF1175 family)